MARGADSDYSMAGDEEIESSRKNRPSFDQDISSSQERLAAHIEKMMDKMLTRKLEKL